MTKAIFVVPDDKDTWTGSPKGGPSRHQALLWRVLVPAADRSRRRRNRNRRRSARRSSRGSGASSARWPPPPPRPRRSTPRRSPREDPMWLSSSASDSLASSTQCQASVTSNPWARHRPASYPLTKHLRLEGSEEHVVLPNGLVLLFTSGSLLLVDAPGFAALDGAAELGSIPAEVDPGSVKWRIEWTNLLDIQLASASVLRVIERGREVREVVCLSGTPQASQVKLIASRISAMCEPGTR